MTNFSWKQKQKHMSKTETHPVTFKCDMYEVKIQSVWITNNTKASYSPAQSQWHPLHFYISPFLKKSDKIEQTWSPLLNGVNSLFDSSYYLTIILNPTLFMQKLSQPILHIMI